MGLIKAAFGAAGSTLADQWKEYIYCDAMDQETLVKKGEVRVTGGSNTKRSENIITNGSKIAVNEGQTMLIVENGKVVDFSAEPGAYTYDTGTEPSLFDGGMEGLKKSFQTVGKRFTFGGQAENDQRVYFVNTKEIMENKVGIGDVPFRDSEFGFTIMVRGYGTYSFKIADPVLFYTNVCANVSESYRLTELDDQLKTEVQHSLQPALGKIAQKGIAYDQIPLYTNDIAAEVNQELSKEWGALRGIQVVSIALASITVDEESAKKIAQFQESRVYTNAQMMAARLGGAQANAMEAAAQNTGGAMQGFIGMGMANQAGAAANVAGLYQIGAQQQAAQGVAPEAALSGDGWACACGATNVGNFCSNCGAKKPEAAAWKCACGADNTGKFCSSCGAKRPEA